MNIAPISPRVKLPAISPLALAILMLLAPSTARAAEPLDPSYISGVQAFQSGDYLKAREDFDASLAVRPDPKTALYLGNTYLKLGQLDEAKAALELALELDPRTSKRDAIAKLIRGIDAKRVGRLSIRSTPPGAVIHIDTRDDGRHAKAPLDASVTPGKHSVIAELDGYETATREVEIKAGEAATVEMALLAPGCNLSFSSGAGEVAGARAALDGAPPVALPTTLRLTKGDHVVVLTAEGFGRKELKAACDGRGPIVLDSTLVALPASKPDTLAPKTAVAAKVLDGPDWQTPRMARTQLVLDSVIEARVSPSDTVVLIDGRVVRAGELVSVAAGVHRLEARAAGYRTALEDVIVRAAQLLRVEVRLARDRGVISPAMGVGIGTSVLAVMTEACALIVRSQASREFAGTVAYQRLHDAEIGTQVAAGALAGAAIISFGIELARGRSRIAYKLESVPKVGASVLPDGGGVTLSGRF